jgi:hypothetical protein
MSIRGIATSLKNKGEPDLAERLLGWQDFEILASVSPGLHPWSAHAKFVSPAHAQTLRCHSFTG